MKNALFPVGCNAHWFQPEHGQLTNIEQSWLLDQDSLTAKLKAACGVFRVELLGQERLVIAEHEADIIANKGPHIVREVLLYCDEQPWVFARSIIPESLQQDPSSIFNKLGKQALGERLFLHNNYSRSEFAVARFEAQSSVHHLATQLAYPSTKTLWGRRSCFMIHEQALLVQEIFLPASALFTHKESV